MEKTSAPGTTVRLHLRPAVSDLTPGWEAIQTSLRAYGPLALSAEHRQGAPSHVAAVGTNLGSRRDPQTPSRPVEPPLRVGPAAKQRGCEVPRAQPLSQPLLFPPYTQNNVRWHI